MQAAKAPVVILNLQPTRTLDYEAHDHRRVARELLGVLRARSSPARSRGARIPYRTVTGTLLDGDPAWDAIGDGSTAAAAVRSLRTARLGFLGHTYPGMLDMYSDFTQVHAQTGAHVEVLEIDDLVARVEAATAGGRRAQGRRDPRSCSTWPSRARIPIAGEITPEAFEWSARVAVGLDALVDGLRAGRADLLLPRRRRQRRTSASAAGLIVGNSLLTARGVPASGEGDLKTNIAMLLLDRLGAGGSYTEFYALDFDEEFMLMGHDGPGHVAISDGRPVAPRAEALPRQGRRRPVGRVQGAARAGDDPRPDADGRRTAEAAGCRGRVDRRADLPHRQHELAHPVRRRARPRSWTPGAPRGRPTTSRSAIGHQLGRIRKVADLLGVELAVVGMTAVRFLGPDTDAYVASVERHRDEFGASRRASTSTSRIVESDLYYSNRIEHLLDGEEAADVYMSGPVLVWEHLANGYVEPLDDLAANASDDWEAGDFFEPLLRCNRWTGRFGDALGTGSLLEVPVNCESYNLAYVPAVLEQAGVEVPRTWDEYLAAARTIAARTDRRGFAQRGTDAWHTIYTGWATQLWSYGGADFVDGRCALAAPESVRLTEDLLAALREAGPTDWPNQRWYELALDFCRGRYGLIVDSDHYVAYFEDPAVSPLAGEIAYALPPVGPTGSAAPTSGPGRS